MKLGLLTAILPNYSLRQVVDAAADIGYCCLEVACWPREGESRRYAGTSHIDVAALDGGEIQAIKEIFASRQMELGALCYYPNPLSPDRAAQQASIAHLRGLIVAARRLGVARVNTFIGRDKNKTVEENFRLFREVWPDIIRLAEENGVQIGIENCPMYFTADEWPGGNNLASSPAIWERMFEEIDSPCFGLNYDPSHLCMQGMDYITPIYTFREKIFHVHFKDVRVSRRQKDRYGILAPPLCYMTPKLPGLGDIDWPAFVSALYDIGFEGPACVEIEDKTFEGSTQRVLAAMGLCYRYLSAYVG